MVAMWSDFACMAILVNSQGGPLRPTDTHIVYNNIGQQGLLWKADWKDQKKIGPVFTVFSHTKKFQEFLLPILIFPSDVLLKNQQ